MKKQIYFVLGALGLLVASCQKANKDNPVVSQRYVHKYGYAVSQEEWEANRYPGQVITHLTNGVTITVTYENGMKHGPCTHTYPHSQTVEKYFLYNQNSLVKEIIYDHRGMPVREMVQLSPSRRAITVWYIEGNPMCIEEYAGEELLEGQYCTLNNEIEARVEKGHGLRIRRDQMGTLLSKDLFDRGYMVKRESFFPNGSPESIIHYKMGKLHGEKKTYAISGEPIAIEEWLNGRLHGKSTYFKNGVKYLDVSYLDGAKNGIETHYLDGEEISQEISWENDRKHGPSVFYIDGIPQTQWFYDGDLVSKGRYEEMHHLDEMISKISQEVTLYNR
jgi:antitoxin component YwqK of YwqJK toxin-antitoxin module